MRNLHRPLGDYFYVGARPKGGSMEVNNREGKLSAVQAFVDGLVSKDTEPMPLTADVILTSPLDPEHPQGQTPALRARLQARR